MVVNKYFMPFPVNLTFLYCWAKAMLNNNDLLYSPLLPHSLNNPKLRRNN